MSSARTVMVSVAAGLTGRDGASPRRSRIARQHRRAQLVQTQLLSLGLLSLGLLSLGLPSHRSCSRLASPGTAVPLAQPCNTPPTVCRVTQEGGNTIFSLSAIKVVPRERRMLFFGYKLRGAAAWPKLVVPSIEKALAALGSGRAGHQRLEAPSHWRTAALWTPEQSLGCSSPASQPWSISDAPRQRWFHHL